MRIGRPRVEESSDGRFWERVVALETPCWAWMGSVDSGGYGQLQVEGHTAKAHRVSYELLMGPIPEGLTLDHLCRNRSCVNPAHLEAVPLSENILRGIGASARNARKTHCVNGHEFVPENTFVSTRGARTCRTCSRETQRRYRLRKEAQV